MSSFATGCTHSDFVGLIMSSKLPSVLSATDEEIQLLLAAQCHIGTKNCDKQMEPYVWKRRADG
jgi:small subunit ribosomal protein SAe